MGNTAKAFFAKFGNDWTMNLASMMAYNILTTIFPIMLALLTILGFILSGNHALLASLEQAILQALPDQIRGAIDIKGALEALAKNKGLLSILSLLGLLWGGSNLFGAMESTFDIIFRTKPRELVPQKLMSFIMIIVFALLVPVMFGASTLITTVGQGAGALIPVKNIVTQLALQGLSLLAATAVAFVLFLAIYVVVPNLPLSFRHAWRGALAAGVLLVIVDLAFPTYVNLTMSGSKNYGSTIYLALIFVAWCWLFSVILLLGAEVNSYAMGMRALEGDLPTVVHRHRVHQQGEDVLPSHEGRTESASGRERRADKLDRKGGKDTARRGDKTAGAQNRGAGQPAAGRRPLPVRLVGDAAGATGRGVGRVLGNVGTVVLAGFWLVYRAFRRRGEPAA